MSERWQKIGEDEAEKRISQEYSNKAIFGDLDISDGHAWSYTPDRTQYSLPLCYLRNIRDLWLYGILGETNLGNKFLNLMKLWLVGYAPLALVYTLCFMLPQVVLSFCLETNCYWETLNQIVYAPLFGAFFVFYILFFPVIAPLQWNKIEPLSNATLSGEIFPIIALIVGGLLFGVVLWFACKKVYMELDKRNSFYRTANYKDGFMHKEYNARMEEYARSEKIKAEALRQLRESLKRKQ